MAEKEYAQSTRTVRNHRQRPRIHGERVLVGGRFENAFTAQQVERSRDVASPHFWRVRSLDLPRHWSTQTRVAVEEASGWQEFQFVTEVALADGLGGVAYFLNRERTSKLPRPPRGEFSHTKSWRSSRTRAILGKTQMMRLLI